MSTPTCPECGGHRFRLYVEQRIFVEFTEGEHEVYDGPEGDMEWDDTTEVHCEGDDGAGPCEHYGLLGSMKGPL